MHGITDDDDDDDAPQLLFWPRKEGARGEGGRRVYVCMYVCMYFRGNVGYPRPGTDKCAPKSMHRVA